MRIFSLTVLLIISTTIVFSQPIHFNKEEKAFEKATLSQGEIPINRLQWLPDSHDFWISDKGSVFLYSADDLKTNKLIISNEQIKASGLISRTESIVWSTDRNKILIYTNSKKVWRGNTRGDYWYFDLKTGKGKPLGKGLPSSSLMFAKFSPDNKNVAYVSKHNLYVENIATGKINRLTNDGTDRIINGTFDWVYEEELSCRDGFRWSPDGKSIAYWRVDARPTKNYLMINNTDSLYPFIVPMEYPVAGEKPSSVKIGIVTLSTKKTNWLQIPGDPANNYLPRMDWAGNNKDIMVIQLNRRQNEASLYMCNALTGKATKIYTDKDETWVDVVKPFGWDGPSWTWVENGKSFLWTSEKDGWMHIYKISRDGKKEELLTRGNFDADMTAYDPTGENIFF